MSIRRVLGLFLMGASFGLNAANLGVYGQVYPIVEIDMTTFIHERLAEMQASGQLAAMENTFKANVIAHSLRPTPVSGITTTSTMQTLYYSPVFTVPTDIYDNTGKLLYPAGTSVNALDIPNGLLVGKGIHTGSGSTHVTFNQALIFINADDPTQVQFAKDAQGFYGKTLQVEIILVQGNIADAGKALGRIYFDQYGVITGKLGIHHVPAIVTQSGDRLKIVEYPDTHFIPTEKENK